MRKSRLLVSIAIVASALTYLVARPTGDGPRWIVEPGPVVASGQKVLSHGKIIELKPPAYVSGSVKLRQSVSGAESKSGGGCLIYLPKAEKKCEEDATCNRLRSKVRVENGYCATTLNRLVDSSGNIFTPTKKACWYKPEPESCVRSKELQGNFPTTFEPPKVPAHPRDAALPTPWRVVSCQNLNPEDPNHPGCKTDDPQKKKLRFGTITFVE